MGSEEIIARHTRAQVIRSTNYLSARVPGNDFLATHPVLSRNDGAMIKMVARFSNRVLHLSSFSSHDSQIEVWKFCGASCGFQRHRKIVFTRDAEAVAIQRARVILPPHQGPHLGNARQMCRVQAANRPTPDDADALHAILKLSAPASPVCRPDMIGRAHV